MTAFTKIQRPLYVKHPMMKFAWTRAEDSEIVSFYIFYFILYIYQNNKAYELWTPSSTRHGRVDTANVKNIGHRFIFIY